MKRSLILTVLLIGLQANAEVVTWEASGTLTSVDTSGGFISEYPGAQIGSPFALKFVFDSGAASTSETVGSSGIRYRYTTALTSVTLSVDGEEQQRTNEGFTSIDIWDDFGLSAMDTPSDGFNLIWGVQSSQQGGFAQVALILRGPEELGIFSGPGLPAVPSPLLSALSTQQMQFLDQTDLLVGTVDRVRLTFGSKQVLLRRNTDNRWFVYTVRSDNNVVTIGQQGPLGLPRNAAYQTVSRSDFNGNGVPDLLVRDMTGAQNGRWVMSTLEANTVTSQGFVDLTRNADWQVRSSNDFDGDGKADLLLRNVVDGRWFLYLLNAQTVSDKSVIAMSTDLSDTFAGSRDFNGDGRADVLLRRADGGWRMYLLDGLNAPDESSPAMTSNLQFEIQALADFNGSGTTDVLMRRADGRWFMYLLDGPMITGSGAPAMSENLAFGLESSADFNGDGNADALLRRQDGRWYLYSLDGVGILNEGSVPMTRNTAFRIVCDADMSGDEAADLLLRRTDGRWVLYNLDGDGPTVLGQGVPDMTRNEAWEVQ